ncbi:hypothetical protein GCM10027396_30040 [Insolitispirillum peregrinum]
MTALFLMVVVGAMHSGQKSPSNTGPMIMSSVGAEGRGRAVPEGPDSKLSYRSAMWGLSLGAAALLGVAALMVVMAFLRIVTIADKAEQEVVPQVLLQQQQAVMAADLARVAEMILGTTDRDDRASALNESESIAHQFALVANIDVQSKLDAALHAVRRSAYRADMRDALDQSISGHLIRVDALLPPLGGTVGKADSYATQLLFETRHVLYEAAIAPTEARLQNLRERFAVLGQEMATVSQNGAVPRTGGRAFTLEEMNRFSVIFDLRAESLAVREQVRSETATARRQLAELSNSLSADAAANASQSASDIVAMGHSGVILVGLASGIALLVLGAVMVFLVRHTMGPILRAHSALEAIRRGETAVHVEPSSLREFNAIGQSVEQLGTVLAQLKVKEQAALRTQEQLQFIFDVSPVPFILNNVATSEVIAANDAACALFRLEKDAFVGRLMREFWIHPRHREEMISFLDQNGSVNGFETHMLTSQGSDFWANISARTVVLDGTQVVLSAFYDVTEQRAYETRLHGLVQDLEDTNSELEQFAYVASHDLQEPLRLVMSYLQLLKMRNGDALSSEGQEFLGFAVDAARRMQQVILDLLAYSHVGRDVAVPQPVPLQEVLRDVQEILSVAIAETQGRLDVAESLPVLKGERGELVRLFQNLVGNALKYHAADRSPHIRVFARQDNGGWEITVADNGIGIPEDYRSKVFEMFQRLHGEGEYSGTGIGLAICRKIVEQHKGRIWVDPDGGCGAQGQGCALKVWLPVVDALTG